MAYAQTIKLLANATVTGAWLNWPGGAGQFKVSCSSWNGATVTLEIQSDDGTTGIAIDNGTTDVTFTANHIGGFTLAPTSKIRAAISGAVPSAGVYVSVSTIPTDMASL